MNIASERLMWGSISAETDFTATLHHSAKSNLFNETTAAGRSYQSEADNAEEVIPKRGVMSVL